MKRKNKIIFTIIIILIAIIIGGILAIVLNKDEEETKKAKKNKEIEWGDVYLKILEDENNFEEMDDLFIQIADLDEDSIPEMIVYGSNEEDYSANIYKINEKNKADVIKVEEKKEFAIKYLYNTEKEDNMWYLVSDENYYEFDLQENEYVKEETDYIEDDFEEVNEKLNKQIEFDKTLEKEEVQELFVEAQDNYVPIEKVKKSTPLKSVKKEEKDDDKEIENYDSQFDTSKIDTFVKYKDEIYYWELSSSSRETGGIYGNYNYTNSENKLVKVDKDGNSSIVYEGNGCGELVILNDKIFTYQLDSSSYYLDIISIDLKDKKKEVYTTGEMKTIVNDNIICCTTKGTDELFTISSKNGEMKTIRKGVKYVGVDNGILYYEEDYYSAYTATGEKCLNIGTIENETDKGIVIKLPTSNFNYGNDNFSVEQFFSEGDYIYIFYGYRDGSANLLAEGKFVKISKKDGSIVSTFSEFDYLESVFLYKDNSKVCFIYEKGKAIDADSFEVVDVSADIDYFYSNVYLDYENFILSGVNYVQEYTGKVYNILNSDELKAYGFNIGEEYYTSIFGFSVIDDFVYVILDNGSHNSVNDIGWRYSYDRTKTIVLKYNVKTGEKTKILEF